MKKIHKIILLVTAFLVVIGLGFGASKYLVPKSDREKLIVGTDVGFEPFEYIKNGETVGFDVDLVQEVADDLDRELVIEQVAFDGLLAALQAGRIDVVAAGMTATEERAKSVNFSDPYYEASQMIIVKRDNLEIKTKADLKGKKIGVQLGTTGDEMVGEIEDTEKIQFPAVPAVLQELSTGRIDAVVLDNAPAEKYLKNKPELKMLTEQLSAENYALAFNKEDVELLQSANRTIARIKEDGTYDSMMDKYFQVSKVGDEVSTEKMSTKDIFLGEDRYMFLVKGLGITLLVSAVSVIFGVILGLLIVVMRISRFKPFKFLSKKPNRLSEFNPLAMLAKIYTTIIRGTPVLVQLLIFYYVIFSQPGFPKIIIASVAFGLNSAAYIAEILRSGFEALPKGQWEAAESLGFNYRQTIWYITMPQVLKNSLPSLVNEFIALVKETSVVGWIGLADLMRGADNIRFQTATAFESLAAAALIYLLLTTILTRASDRIERRLRVSN